MQYSVLYSFRRCPYAIRARLALAYSGLTVELREVLLRNKPQAMLDISAKATVPVLQLPDGTVLDESLEIMIWALNQFHGQTWLRAKNQADSHDLVSQNDGTFKYYLDRYKYTDRYPGHSAIYYRKQCEVFLAVLEQRLKQAAYLCADYITLADAAIFPFIRQFSMVDQQWFSAAQYPALRLWLQQWLLSPLFLGVMKKYPVWHAKADQQLFPGEPIA